MTQEELLKKQKEKEQCFIEERERVKGGWVVKVVVKETRKRVSLRKEGTESSSEKLGSLETLQLSPKISSFDQDCTTVGKRSPDHLLD